jgi:ABC-type multidrug transport system fused ATPase/permease subunit
VREDTYAQTHMCRHSFILPYMCSMCVCVCVLILPMIYVSSYYKTSTGDRDLMNGVNLRLTAGERVGLVGPNGAVLRTHI